MYIKETNKPNAKDVFGQTDRIINYAFTIKKEDTEIDFFEFQNFNETPMARGIGAWTFMKEFNECVSREYLTFFTEAMNNCITDKGINVREMVKLNIQLEERLKSLNEYDISYKLCSVVYFDGSEDPYTIDFYKANLNAELFRSVKMSTFFLLAPIQKLIPFIHTSVKDLKEYLMAAASVNKRHLEDISTMLSEQTRNSDIFKQFVLRNTTLNL